MKQNMCGSNGANDRSSSKEGMARWFCIQMQARASDDRIRFRVAVGAIRSRSWSYFETSGEGCWCWFRTLATRGYPWQPLPTPAPSRSLNCAPRSSACLVRENVVQHLVLVFPSSVSPSSSMAETRSCRPVRIKRLGWRCRATWVPVRQNAGFCLGLDETNSRSDDAMKERCDHQR